LQAVRVMPTRLLGASHRCTAPEQEFSGACEPRSYVSSEKQASSRPAHGRWIDPLKRAGAPTRRSKKMRLITMIRLFAISVVLLGGAPSFAAPAIHTRTHDICGDSNAGFCHRPPFNVEIPSAIDDGQAKANAASKTWPGDMILD
jgi:hypothetical protein